MINYPILRFHNKYREKQQTQNKYWSNIGKKRICIYIYVVITKKQNE